MLRLLYACVATEHDLRLVGIAALVCAFACHTTINLFVHARDPADGRRLTWLCAASVVFGAGVWATHFIAELAFRPGLPLAYDFRLTGLSLVVAVVVSFAGFAVALRYRPAWLGGLVVGAAVGAMHYLGMAALRIPADVHWIPALVLASLVIGSTLAAAAIGLASEGAGISTRIGAAALLAGSICGLHFTGMAALWLEPDPLIAVPRQMVAPEVLAVAIAAVTILIIGLGLSGALATDQLVRRKRAEAERARASAAHLDLAQRVMGVGSVQADLTTGQIRWSDEFYRIHGFEKGTPVTLDKVRRHVHPDDVAIWDAHIAEIKSGRRCEPLEFRYIHPDGRDLVLREESDVILNDANVPVLQVTTVRDVTRRRAAETRQKELERQLQHSQKLEALGTLAGGIAHELNNTLLPIMALSRLCLAELPTSSPLHDDIETIAVASERARDLVQRIVAFSRKQDFGQEQVDLAAVMREALGMMRASLPATIRIEEAIADVPPLVGDAAQLHQVIVNLMTNAAQAIGDRTGRIAVTLSYAEGTGLCLAVADTGCGMDEAIVSRIFEPFYTTRAVGLGTGLGLSVVHGIVTSHGGRIEVRSAPGEGSEFRVVLPVRDAREAAPEPSAAPSIVSAGARPGIVNSAFMNGR